MRCSLALQLPPAAVDEFYEHLPVLLEYLRRCQPCGAMLYSGVLLREACHALPGRTDPVSFGKPLDRPD